MVDVKHTPTPWDRMGGLIIRVEGPTSCVVAKVDSEEDAAHIVKCVNMHDELVEALNSWVDAMDNGRSTSDSYLTALEILNKAGGE